MRGDMSRKPHSSGADLGGGARAYPSRLRHADCLVHSAAEPRAPRACLLEKMKPLLGAFSTLV